MAEGYLSDLIGVHDLRDSNGVTMPRRNVVTILDADVRDDPAAGETVIAFRRTQAIELVTPVGNMVLPNTDADMYRVDDNATLYGLGTPPAGYGRKLVFIVNASDGVVTLEHDSVSAAAAERFLASDSNDLSLPPEAVAVVIHDGSAWRIVL